jgi:general secretion pathway protein G
MKSEQGVAKAQIEAFSRALDAYRLDTGAYPSSEEGLKALLDRPSGSAKWNGPYLQKAVPDDPWGRPYVYRVPGTKSDYDLYTFGRDGQQGGSGDAADIGVP